jgi:hypothetical protein
MSVEPRGASVMRKPILFLLVGMFAAAAVAKMVGIVVGGSVARDAILALVDCGILAVLLSSRWQNIGAWAIMIVASAGMVYAIMWPDADCGCLGVVRLRRGQHLLLAGLSGALAASLLLLTKEPNSTVRPNGELIGHNGLE